MIGVIHPMRLPCFFAGEIGDFTAYGRALTEKEVRILAKNKPEK